MDANLIEKYVREKYRLLVYSTASMAIWFGAFILKDVITDKMLSLVVSLIVVVGAIAYAVFSLRSASLSKKIKAVRLEYVLNDEMYRINVYKSYAWGYGCTLGALCLAIIVCALFNIPALLICKIVLYAGILSSMISLLIYHYRS